MRKLFLSTLAVFGLVLTSCQKDDNPGLNFGRASLSALDITVKGGTFGDNAGKDPTTSGGEVYDDTISVVITDSSGTEVVNEDIAVSGNKTAVLNTLNAKSWALSLGVHTISITSTGDTDSDSSGLTVNSFTGSLNIEAAVNETISLGLSPSGSYISVDIPDDANGVSFSFTGLPDASGSADGAQYLDPGTYTIAVTGTSSGTTIASSSTDITIAAGEYKVLTATFDAMNQMISATLSDWTSL